MGGEGSGRKPDVVKMMWNQQTQAQQQAPIAPEMFLPNYSGVKQEALKTSVNRTIVTGNDDGTYITFYFNSTAVLRVEKATGQIQVPAGVDTDISL